MLALNKLIAMTSLTPFSAARLLTLMSMGLLLMTCKSQEDMLPSATQTGQNTFGCLIDGKSYVPNGGNGFMPAKPVKGGFLVLTSIPYTLGIYIRTYARDRQRIELYLNNYTLGKHSLNNNTQTIPVSIYPKDYGLYESDTTDYVTSTKYTGWVNLTKADSATGVVSGTFEVTAGTKDGKTISVTSGRFDVNARTQ